MPGRLRSLHEGLLEVITRLKPQALTVEKAFFAKNAVSALKLGQARGVILLSGALNDLEIHEYSATEVKKTLVGHGHAEKSQVAQMAKLLSGCGEFPTPDASDALALAICHGLCSRSKLLELTRPGKAARVS
jgi:crossover junction endodeoxyribonuclease RuvC